MTRGDPRTTRAWPATAHWLKGAGGTVGFAEFTEPARGLEQAARGKDLHGVAQIMTEIIELTEAIELPGLPVESSP